jgi:hypothetical protein
MAKKIRLWQLGNLDQKIVPTKEAVCRLQDLVSKADSEETINIVWENQTLKITEFNDNPNELRSLEC